MTSVHGKLFDIKKVKKSKKKKTKRIFIFTLVKKFTFVKK